jgi:putative copper export protein
MATQAAVKRIPRVFDKYMLPKVAFTLVSTASIVGSILTGLRQGWEDWPVLALRWATYWFLGMLLGSEIWKIFYLRPSVNMRPVPRAVEYGDAMIKLHTTLQRVLAPVGLMLAAGSLATYASARPTTAPWALTGGLFLVVALGGFLMNWSQSASSRKQDIASWVTLAGLACAVATMGGMDVTIQPRVAGDLWLLIPNRALHLFAFSAWLGGALWNIFIAVPAGKVRENMDTVILANFQLERFRVVVRTVFPTIVATGLIQAWAMFGFQWEPYFHTTWGLLVLTKIGLILGLVGVFIACPMWGACSPIRGVCNLDDLYNNEEAE